MIQSIYPDHSVLEMLKSRSNFLLLLLLVAILLGDALIPAAQAVAAASQEIPAESFKTLPMVQERSVSTYVPSDVAPDGGLAVTLSYPTMPRYEEGAPVVVLVPGDGKASGLRFTTHAVQAGFVEVKFAFPGGGLKKFHSGGSWDNRGKNSQRALADVLLYAAGKKKDYKNRSIQEIVPRKVNTANLGLLGWHDGFNIAIITLCKFHPELKVVKWLASFESPVGALLLPSNLGTTRELNLNPHYKQGSAATGKVLIDYEKIAWLGEGFRNRALRRKQKLHTPQGVLFFDDNENGRFDETVEFPLNYGVMPGVEKQYYAPEITIAMKTRGVFHQWVPKETPEEKKERLKKEALEKPPVKTSKAPWSRFVKGGGASDKTTATPPSGAAVKPDADEPKKVEKPKLGDVKDDMILKEVWPDNVARLKESEAYYQERDGALYIEKLGELYPDLLVTIFGSRIDHNEQQVDHPHIALAYNLFLGSKIKWVRLNPARVYVGFTADMNPENFVNNKIKGPIEASNIKAYLEPEGYITDAMYMRAVISELADRTKHKDLSCPLDGVLENYLNEALIERQLERESQTEKEE